VKKITEDQPFIPKYFGYDVVLNKKGAPAFADSIAAVPRIDLQTKLDENTTIIDTRPQDQFKAGHLKNAFNLQDGGKFETWLGSIIAPRESFYLTAVNEDSLDKVIRKSAKIGYENQIKGAFVARKNGFDVTTPSFDMDEFTAHPEKFTIVDIRNESEVKAGKLFENAIAIPLPELRERISEIPRDKPIVIHCAGGYRSAAGSSMVEQEVKEVPVLDMSDYVTKFPVKYS
jgi:rhodanese-related sulfurtransferase